jgi:hypothetical protein
MILIFFGMLHQIVWYIFTDVSEEPVMSIKFLVCRNRGWIKYLYFLEKNLGKFIFYCDKECVTYVPVMEAARFFKSCVYLYHNMGGHGQNK